MSDSQPEDGIAVAYLVNLYPKISHSFIRREIQALESHGVTVHRYAIRRADEPLVDDADRDERGKTKVLLDLGAPALLTSSLGVALRHPIRFLRSLTLAVRTGLGSDRGLARHFAYVVEACALLGLLERDPVDHLHAHFGTNATAVAMYCAALGGPGYSFTAHGTESFESPARIRLGLKAKRARFVVTVCEHGRRELIASSPGIEAGKVHVVRCGLDESFRTEPAFEGITGVQLTVVGRLSPEKGHRVLLDAANRLHRDHVDFRIVLVGDGELRSEIEDQIASFGLRDRIHIAGWQDSARVREILTASRALVLASFGEGLPVVIMEAMAMGRPVVATDVGGVSELVVDCETGWLVPPGDPRGLAEVMKLVLGSSDEELTAAGAHARARVLRMHDVRREASNLKELFERYAT
jgi:glycosyltransferase involved in cell wall biosynthesis